MLQELAARTGASVWAITSMLFFLAAYLVVAVGVRFGQRSGDETEPGRVRLPARPGEEMADPGRVVGRIQLL